jgi:hypothetical protein
MHRDVNKRVEVRLPVYAPWMRSFLYVSGEKDAMTGAKESNDASGMKTPDMNMSRNLTRFTVEMIPLKLSVGYAVTMVVPSPQSRMK